MTQTSYNTQSTKTRLSCELSFKKCINRHYFQRKKNKTQCRENEKMRNNSNPPNSIQLRKKPNKTNNRAIKLLLEISSFTKVRRMQFFEVVFPLGASIKYVCGVWGLSEAPKNFTISNPLRRDRTRSDTGRVVGSGEKGRTSILGTLPCLKVIISKAKKKRNMVTHRFSQVFTASSEPNKKKKTLCDY